MARPREPAKPAVALTLPRATSVKQYSFRLYVAGTSGRSALALHNIRALCEELLAGHYSLEVVDLLKDPEKASADEIIAIPTLVRLRPKPVRRVLGDLSDRPRVLLGLDLLEAGP